MDRLAGIVVSDLDSVDLENEDHQKLWDEIALDNKLSDEILADAIKDTLIDGDGVFKLSVDPDLSKYPIIEFYSGSDISYTYIRNRLQEVIFHAYYTHEKKTYRLDEVYGRGFIDYKLYDDQGKEVPISKVPEVSHLTKITFTGDFIMAVPMRFFKSAKFEGRGNSIFERKSDNLMLWMKLYLNG